MKKFLALILALVMSLTLVACGGDDAAEDTTAEDTTTEDTSAEDTTTGGGDLTFTTGESKCIQNISQMFYQSLLCPENSTYMQATGTAGSNGYVNTHCKCNTGYEIWGSSCLKKCNEPSEERDSYGVCQCRPGYELANGVCTKVSGQ